MKIQLKHLSLEIKVELAWCHEQVDDFLCNFSALLLDLRDNRLKAFDSGLLDFSAQHLAGAVCNSDFFELGVVFKEESKQLKRNINVGVSSEFTVFFDGHSASRKSVLVNLRFDLLRCIG